MKVKFLKRISIIISLLFLIFLSLLTIFVVTISIKPVKINFLNYFDRESQIIKGVNISEIGDVYLSFNKITKNFEIMIEELIVDQSYIPNLLIATDFNFTEGNNFFQTSIKIFDGDFFLNFSNSQLEGKGKSFSVYQLVKEKYNLLENFSKIEIINSKFKLSFDKDEYVKFLIDLKFDANNTSGFIKQNISDKNFFSFSLDKLQNANILNLEFENFNIDFLRFFFKTEFFNFQNLVISGNSKITDTASEEIEELIFDLFVSGDVSYKTYNGLEKINFQNEKLIGDFSDNDLKVSFDFSHLNSVFSLGTSFDFSRKIIPNLFFKINVMTIENALKIWPENLMNSTYVWMKSNTKGVVRNFVINMDAKIKDDSIAINDLKGSFDCNDVKVTYMESMPEIISINGNAIIEKDKVIFNVENGFSKNLSVKNAKIELYDLDTNFEKANIDLLIDSKVLDVVKYLDTSPIDKKKFSKLRKINGKSSIKLNLKFPLLVDLEAEKIDYRSDVEISDAGINDFYKGFDLDELVLKLLINSEEVNYEGKTTFKDSRFFFTGSQDTKDNLLLDNINGNGELFGKSIFDLFPGLLDNYSGKIPINFSYSSQDEEKFKIEGVGELHEFNAGSSFLGDELDFRNGKIRFLVRPFNESFSGFFDINSPDVKIEINFNFNDEKLETLEISKFRTPIQNFNAKIKNDKNLEIFLSGEKLTINELEIDKKNENDKDIFNANNFNFSSNINTLYLNKKKFSKPVLNFNKRNDIYDFLNIKLTDSDYFHKISIKTENMENIFYLDSTNASELFKLIDLNLNIESGNLEVRGRKSVNSIQYDGLISGKDFVLRDGPFLTDFLTLFSLKGLTQKLKGGGIFFESFEGKYQYNDNQLNIKDSLIKGSDLGIQFDAEMNMEDETFSAKGSIIPAYTINTLLTKFPIVGDIITAGSPEDGLIGANFEINKVDGDYKVSFNPISVFVPNLIKNFLSN